MADGYHHIRTVEQLLKLPFRPVDGVEIAYRRKVILSRSAILTFRMASHSTYYNANYALKSHK